MIYISWIILFAICHLLSKCICDAASNAERNAFEQSLYLSQKRLNPIHKRDARIICDTFYNSILSQNRYLRGHILIIKALEACATLRDVPLAQMIWKHITTDKRCANPNPTQLLYSKMLKVYTLARDSFDFKSNAESLFDEWKHKYLYVPKSLQGGLKMPINEPVIINQMLKMIPNLGGQGRSHQYYLKAMIELDICPDEHTAEIMRDNPPRSGDVVGLILVAKNVNIANWIINEWCTISEDSTLRQFLGTLRLKIENNIFPDIHTMILLNTPEFRWNLWYIGTDVCMELMLLSNTIEMAEFLLERWLYPLIGSKINFLKWDEENGKVISNHIRSLDELAYFRLFFFHPGVTYNAVSGRNLIRNEEYHNPSDVNAGYHDINLHQLTKLLDNIRSSNTK